MIKYCILYMMNMSTQMSIDRLQKEVLVFVQKYNITKITLFGSRADGTNTESSDVDLILEFSVPVSMLTLSKIKLEMQESLKLDVDIIHGPITDDDFIEVKNEVVLYAA